MGIGPNLSNSFNKNNWLSEINRLCQQVNTSVRGRRFVLVRMGLPEYTTAA